VAESGSFALKRLKRLNWVAGRRVASIRLPSGGAACRPLYKGIGSDEAERARLSVPAGGGVAERGGEGLFALPLTAARPRMGAVGEIRGTCTSTCTDISPTSLQQRKGGAEVSAIVE